MRFSPRGNMIMGRMVIRKTDSLIILTDQAKVTKFILVDGVGPDAATKGIKVGDLVIASALGNIVMDRGTVYLPICEEKNIVFFVEDVKPEQLLVQDKGGNNYVAFDSEDAAPNVAAPAREPEAQAAAQ
jgi:hypothetical protein